MYWCRKYCHFVHAQHISLSAHNLVLILQRVKVALTLLQQQSPVLLLQYHVLAMPYSVSFNVSLQSGKTATEIQFLDMASHSLTRSYRMTLHSHSKRCHLADLGRAWGPICQPLSLGTNRRNPMAVACSFFLLWTCESPRQSFEIVVEVEVERYKGGYLTL